MKFLRCGFESKVTQNILKAVGFDKALIASLGKSVLGPESFLRRRNAG